MIIFSGVDISELPSVFNTSMMRKDGVRVGGELISSFETKATVPIGRAPIYSKLICSLLSVPVTGFGHRLRPGGSSSSTLPRCSS